MLYTQVCPHQHQHNPPVSPIVLISIIQSSKMDYAGNYSPESSHCVSERQMGRRTNTNITVLGKKLELC